MIRSERMDGGEARGYEKKEKKDDSEREQREDRDREKRERSQKGIEMTISRGDGGTSTLASACCSASSRHWVTPVFPTLFCSKTLQQ